MNRPTASKWIISRLAQQIAPQKWRGNSRKHYSVADLAEFLAPFGNDDDAFVDRLKDSFNRLHLTISDSPDPGATFWLRPCGKPIEMNGESKWLLCAVITDRPEIPQVFAIGDGFYWHEVRVDCDIPLIQKVLPPAAGQSGIYKRDMPDDFLKEAAD